MRRRDLIFVAATLAVGWGFWLHRMGINDHDDMLSNELLFAGERLTTLLFRNPWPDQSPLYFLYLRAVSALAESPLAFQLANAVLLTMTLIATYLLAVAFSGSTAVARAALVLGTVSPTSLWLVRNGRMYSLQLLFSVLACLFVLRFLDRRRTRDLVAFSLLSLLNIYTHFFGFLITALLFVPVLADGWIEARRLKTERPSGTWRALRPALFAGLAVLALALPQVVRFVSLVSGAAPPARAEVSLPPLSLRFLDRVSRFWFVNADWGALRPGEQLVMTVYVGSIVLLAIASLAVVRRRMGVTAAIWILVPLAIVGLAAARMDVRDRYFVWTLPMLWIAVATGGLGQLASKRLTGARAEIARGVRSALLVAVTAGSLWLLWHKLPERFGEWTKLMSGVAHIYRPSMMVYMPPGSPLGIPRFVATHRQLPAGLRDVRELSASTRPQFLQEIERGLDFIFLLYYHYDNDEMRWRIRHLEERGYRRGVLPVHGATAHIFTRADTGGWSEEQRLAPNPSPDTIVSWARQQLRDRPSTSSNEPVLADALVARVQPDGVARVGRIFISQRGEHGSWRLGPRAWDAVEEVRTSSGTVAQDVIAAHPATDSTLVVALPALSMKKSLDLSYGIADSGLMFRAGAAVDVVGYVNGKRAFHLSCPNTPGWKTFAADTAGLEGQAADVVLLLTTADETSRHFAFRLQPSSQAAPRSAQAAHASGPVVLTDRRTLKEAVGQLRVYRLEGERRIAAQHDGRIYSAAEMHEAEGAAGDGAVRRTWALGPALWDAVGVTRQRSGGEARDGLWAHPRNGTTLVVEAAAVHVGQVLRGHFGLTDFSVGTARAVGVRAPVRFRISLDGRSVFEQDVPRTAGWKGLAIPIGGASGPHSLKIEIASAVDSWAHFVFDLWSE